MVGYYNYTVLLTYLGLASSVVGMTLACGGKLIPALVCLLFSGLCDAFDGKVAKTRTRTEAEKRFGIQIDSLCDVICFGVFPAVIGYCVGLRALWQLPVLIFYVLAGVIRLAYFNVTEEERQSRTDASRKEYKGLPISAAALLIPLIFLLRPLCGEWFSLLYGAWLLAVGFAFIAPVRVCKPGLRGELILVALGAVLGVVLFLIRR